MPATEFFKRTLDVLLSVLALILLAPLLMLIGVAIRADSSGPILYRQTRVGQNGSEFGMLKFRSMRTDGEGRLPELKSRNEAEGILFKMEQDPRVTRVGRVLRRYSLDELPQFWNVLIGQMSVVGPRPPLRTEVDAHDGDVVGGFYVKPGITGLWQVISRSDLTWEESVRLNLYYVENWSLGVDLAIIARTIKAIV